jgi:hypothetical protein
MKTLNYSVSIKAPVEKVWTKMLEDEGYRQWTAAFHPGSYYKGKFEKGAEIRFIGPDEKGNEQGMFSMIKELRKHEFVSIEHQGLIKDGQVDTTSEDVRKWAPSYENYSFSRSGEETKVDVEMQSPDEYADHFDQMWPNALAKLKEISEK